MPAHWDSRFDDHLEDIAINDARVETADNDKYFKDDDDVDDEPPSRQYTVLHSQVETFQSDANRQAWRRKQAGPTNSRTCNFVIVMTEGLPVLIALGLIIFGWISFNFVVGGK